MFAELKKIRHHNGFMKYFNNTSWLAGERVLRLAVGLLISVWVARYLGPENFGLISYAQSFVFLFSAFGTLGLDNIVIRELLKDNTERDILLGTSFTLKLIGAVLILPLLAIAVLPTSNSGETNVLIFIIASATIFQSFNVIDYYYQSEVLSKFVAISNSITLGVSSLVKIALIINEAPLIFFAIVSIIDSFVLAVALIYCYTITTRKNIFLWQFEWGKAKFLLQESWPLIISSMVLMIQARIDQVMLKEMVGEKEVGFYSVAMRLIESVAFLTIIVKSSLYPSIQKAKNLAENVYQDRLLNFYRLNFLLFLFVAIPIFFFAEDIVLILFGQSYQPAGILLSLMAIRIFFANMGVSRSVFILTENLIKFSVITMIIGTLTNIALNYLWIEEYGGKGAIYATIVSFLVSIFLIDFMYSKTRKNVLLQINAIFSFYKINLGRH